MSNRQRSQSLDNPLLGMIVDRTSFDEEDLLGRQSRSHDDDDSLSGDSISSLGMRKTRSGKVRRKLRWKPPGFRKNRRRPSSTISVLSSSDKSSRTNQSTMSFHTFHSTETPVIGNTKKQTPIMSRPNYPDSFEGLATINNEGNYVHSRLNQKSSADSKMPRSQTQVPRNQKIPRSQTIPPSIDEKRWGGWDFNSVADSNWDPYGSTSPTVLFDPYGDAIDTSKRGGLPPKQTKPLRPKPSAPDTFSTPRESRSDAKRQLHPSPAKTPSTAATSFSDISLSTLPILENDEYEDERQIDLLQTRSPRRSFSGVSGADAAAGLAVSPVKSIPSPGNSSRPSTPDNHSPITLTPRLSGGRALMRPESTSPVLLEKPDPPALVMSSDDEPPESFEAVPAKVNINLDNPSNLNSMVEHSGLLNGKQYLPKQYTSGMPLTSATHKAYNRPVDRSSSTISNSTDGLRHVSDDDSLSTKNSNRSGEVFIEELQDISDGDNLANGIKMSEQATDQKPAARKNIGPVDLDDGSFLEAEKNLRAIHDMAAEHLAHGEFVEALEVFEEILRGQKERYGPEHHRVGTALHNIGIVHLKSREYEKAAEVCQEAVRVRKKALAANHPDVAVSLAQLGVAQLECCQYRRALIAFREALKIRREFLGPKHPKVGKILNNIGCALFAVDELEGAKLAFEEALEIQRETLRGDSSPQSNQILLSIASTLCNLGSIKVRWGLYEDASVSLEEALLIQQSVLGDDHPAVLNTVKSIDFVDRAINGEDDLFGSYKDLYSCQSPPDFLVRSDSVDTNEMNMSCNATPPGVKRVMNFNILQTLGFDKSKRWYRKIEQSIASEATCGTRETKFGTSRVKSPRRSRKSRAEI